MTMQPSTAASRSRSDPQNHQARALLLASALLPGVAEDPQRLAEAGNQLMAEVDPQAIKRLHRRYLLLGEQDSALFRQMVQDGAHRSVLLQFIAATQDQPMNDSPSRDKIYRAFQERRARQKVQRPFEVAVRVATPVLFVTTCALILPWAVSKGALAAGVALPAATNVLAFLDPLAKPVVDLVMQETGGWLARSAMAVGAWVGWGYAARVVPDLKARLSEAETQILDRNLGPGHRNGQLHAALGKIPIADRHLLDHLLAAELRAFLRGTDEERRDILTRQPPPLMAEAMAVMAANPPGAKNFFRAIRDLGDLCLPAAWRKGLFLNPRIDLDTRLGAWRLSRAQAKAAAAKAQELASTSRVAHLPPVWKMQ